MTHRFRTTIRRPTGRSAFTLVELVTAASLMTVMMVGVVQVFAIITQTAAEAEGIHFAQQQLRALFDRMHNDLRGMTREGYLKVIHLTPDTVDHLATGPYYSDAIAFVAVGPCASAWASPAYEASCAEVVYTSNVRTPDALLRITAGAAQRNVDARRGVVARGQWILSGRTGGSAQDTDDRSALKYLCEMFADQNPPVGASVTPKDRVTLAGGGYLGGYLKVWPWTTLAGASANPASLERVMACCASEFCVEVFDPAGGTTPPGQTAVSPYFRKLTGTQTYKWSSRFIATDVIKSWPRALRVTVAVHDPGDTRLPQQPGQRFRGVALQETFWLTDP